MRILVIEDDRDLADQIRKGLAAAGFVVDLAHDGEDGHHLGASLPYDAVVLDLGLPILDGLSVLARWRAAQVSLPVLILTAREGWGETVRGIDAGADDYLTKPFHMPELLARLRALIRRSAGHAHPELSCGPILLDTRTGTVTVGGRAVALTAQELKVLTYLMHHVDQVISRTELIEHVYDQDFDRDSNTIEVFIARLRRKLGTDQIRTMRGRGYRLVAATDAP